MPHNYQIIEAMQKYGGSFVKALADAWIKADLENRRRLMNAFPELFDKYARPEFHREKDA